MNLELKMNEQLKCAMLLAIELKSKVDEFINDQDNKGLVKFEHETIENMDDKILQVIDSLGDLIGWSIVSNAMSDIHK